MWIFKHNNPFASETNSAPESSRLLRKGGKLGKSGTLKKSCGNLSPPMFKIGEDWDTQCDWRLFFKWMDGENPVAWISEATDATDVPQEPRPDTPASSDVSAPSAGGEDGTKRHNERKI